MVNFVSQPAVPTNVLISVRSLSNPIPRIAKLVLFWSSIPLVGFMHVEVEKTFVEIYINYVVTCTDICFSALVSTRCVEWSARFTVFSYQPLHSSRLISFKKLSCQWWSGNCQWTMVRNGKFFNLVVTRSEDKLELATSRRSECLWMGRVSSGNDWTMGLITLQIFIIY